MKSIINPLNLSILFLTIVSIGCETSPTKTSSIYQKCSGYNPYRGHFGLMCLDTTFHFEDSVPVGIHFLGDHPLPLFKNGYMDIDPKDSNVLISVVWKKQLKNDLFLSKQVVYRNIDQKLIFEADRYEKWDKEYDIEFEHSYTFAREYEFNFLDSSSYRQFNLQMDSLEEDYKSKDLTFSDSIRDYYYDKMPDYGYDRLTRKETIDLFNLHMKTR